MYVTMEEIEDVLLSTVAAEAIELSHVSRTFHSCENTNGTARGTLPCGSFKYSSRKRSAAVTSRLLRPLCSINKAGREMSRSRGSLLTVWPTPCGFF